MYRSTTSFATKDYDVRPKQILEDDFTSEEQIQEFLRIGYIEVYDGTLEITENGQYDVEDYQNADVNVSGGEANLQSKEVTITENGTTTVGADSGYDGLSQVGITTNVPNNPDWSIIGYQSTPKAISDAITYAKQIYDNWDSSITSVASMFNKSTNLVLLPEVDTSNVETFINFCNEARGLIYVPTLNTGSATNMNSAFLSVAVKEFSFTDTSSVKRFSNTFGNNKVLETTPNINTESALDMSGIFKDCGALKNVLVYDLAEATNLQSMFTNCTSLTNESLNNIMEMLIGATSYGGTKTLKNIGLSSTQATTCQTLSNWDAFVTAGWSSGY